jgi:hypothetical protein
MKLYIDIDGVLLGTVDGEPQLSEGAECFIAFVLEKFECYWLTTHCKGSVEPVLSYLRRYSSDDFYSSIQKIKPTSFDVLKTEAIDLSEEFIWIDDSPLNSEIEMLDQHGKLNSWHEVNTYKYPDDLLICLDHLRRLDTRSDDGIAANR